MASPFYRSQDPLLPAISEPTNYDSIDCGPDRDRDITCICHKEIRLEDDKLISQFEKGDHITRPLKCCCGYMHCCFHHAILAAKMSEENMYENKNVVLDVIGYSESNEGKAKIDLVQEILNYKDVDIYKIDYYNPKYEREQVFVNVSNLLGKDLPYHVFLNNCEHICRGCVTGEEKSMQVDTLDKCCVQSVFGCLPRLLRLVLAFLSTVLDEFYHNNHKWILSIQLFALTVYFYLLVRQLVTSQYQYELKQMCKKCRKSSSRNFLMGLLFILISVIEIILDRILHNRCISILLTVVALFIWLIIELCNVCSESCKRNTTRCICLCFFSCFCPNESYNSICGKCCKHHTRSKYCTCFDSFCHCILKWCWKVLKFCYQCLKSCRVYTIFCFFWILYFEPCSRSAPLSQPVPLTINTT